MTIWKRAWVMWGVLLGVSGAARAGGPPLHSNATHYADRSPAAATGRSGNATLTARALLSKSSGETVLDITTGALDAAPESAPGTISKVQIKGFDGNGDVRWVINKSGLNGGGAVQYHYQKMFRGQPFQVQGNIRGIDGNRTDVVTVSNNVRYRPDLKVLSISAPARAVVGMPVNIAATIREINDDSGARADCLLFIGSSTTPADRANGIWVDAGGTVTCAFTHVFQSVGTRTVSVEVAGVTPADDAPSNNRTSLTIDVRANSEPLEWWAYSFGHVGTFHWLQEGYYQVTDGPISAGADWIYTDDNFTTNDMSSFTATSSSRLRFPLASAQVAHRSGTRTLASMSRTNVPADWSWDDGSCGQAGAMIYGEDPSSTYLYILAGYCAGSNYTVFESVRFTGSAVYFSYRYDHSWFQDGNGGDYDYSWTYNYNYSTSWGEGSSQGMTVNMPFEVVDADGRTFSATPTVEAVVNSYSDSSPYACVEYSSTEYYSYSTRTCTEMSSTLTNWGGINGGTN